ncbi:MAG: hypothetical protein ABIK98_14775 [Pseudomonadota bacterium]|uniref:Uncharacterized protein n=1 Tax=Candidatus Desulfatibia profunda TaxID=2841695 RepID=A0A8J6NMU7_9BACT|nr:hypothetical protein [Candidatus Desulfatibia profunda]MBL7180733.1 hypothetical protein [Desulfobacterales bacterium]
MKSFDAVKTMRDIRAQLSERYREDAKRQTDDLRRIREKYNMYSSQPTVEQPKVAENEAKYGDTDSQPGKAD